MTGKELLEQLQSLSKEELELDVYSHDTYGDFEEVWGIEIINSRYDLENGKEQYINIGC